MSTDSIIPEIKKRFHETIDNDSKKKTLDALASYGTKGIVEIKNLIDDPKIDSDVKEYGISLVKNMQDSSTGSLY